jgi:hypothetical protein
MDNLKGVEVIMMQAACVDVHVRGDEYLLLYLESWGCTWPGTTLVVTVCAGILLQKGARGEEVLGGVEVLQTGM